MHTAHVCAFFGWCGCCCCSCLCVSFCFVFFNLIIYCRNISSKHVIPYFFLKQPIYSGIGLFPHLSRSWTPWHLPIIRFPWLQQLSSFCFMLYSLTPLMNYADTANLVRKKTCMHFTFASSEVLSPSVCIPKSISISKFIFIYLFLQNVCVSAHIHVVMNYIKT